MQAVICNTALISSPVTTCAMCCFRDSTITGVPLWKQVCLVGLLLCPIGDKSAHVWMWVIFELRKIKGRGPSVRILGLSNHTRHRHVHPDDSVRLEHVAGEVGHSCPKKLSMPASQCKVQVGTHFFYYHLMHVIDIIHFFSKDKKMLNLVCSPHKKNCFSFRFK
jgi:hypothetical protein